MPELKDCTCMSPEPEATASGRSHWCRVCGGIILEPAWKARAESAESRIASLEARLAEALKWREAITDAAVVNWTLSAENENDPRRAVADLLAMQSAQALDPAVSKEAAEWRDKLAEAARAREEAEKIVRDLCEEANVHHPRMIIARIRREAIEECANVCDARALARNAKIAREERKFYGDIDDSDVSAELEARACRDEIRSLLPPAAEPAPEVK